MTSIKIENISEDYEISQVCRLCLGNECVVNVLKEVNLCKWISEYVAITISTDDPMGHDICSICRSRVTEFHQFRLRCHKVQDTLYSMIHNKEATDQQLGDQQFGIKIESYEKVNIEVHEQNANNDTEHRGSAADNNYVYVLQEIPTKSFHVTQIQDNEQENGLISTIEESEVNVEFPADEDANQSNGEQNSLSKNETQNPTTFPCKDCKKAYHSRRSLRVHIKYNHEPRKHSCQICNVKFAMGKDLRLHERCKTHLDRVKYVQRSKNSETEDTNEHTELVNDEGEHADDDLNMSTATDEEAQCSICHKIYTSRSSLVTHMRKHKINYVCYLCDKAFVNRTLLANHMSKSHEGDVRPFKCNLCSSTFVRGDSLMVHKTKMHAPKDKICHICNYAFTTKEALKRHVKRHNHTQEQSSAPSTI